MKKNTFMVSNNGFSLLEITIVLVIISILLSAVIPVLSRTYLENAAKKTALDMSAIQDASRKFYIDYNKWPDAGSYSSPIANLQALGYLPSGWSAQNPFVNYEPDLSDFNYYISTNSSSLKVYTNVPTIAQPIIENLLPTTSVDLPTVGHNLYSSISVPGEENTIPVGSILAWASSNLPAGYLWCNGQVVSVASYQNLYNSIGATYDVPGDGADGVTTFALPDLMARTVVGIDGMGGAVSTNRITLWGTSPAIIGGTFGESAHTLTMAELPASTFNVQAFMSNGSHEYGIQGSNNGGSLQTANSGMNLGSGTAHNVVQPSIAMGYIIKY